LKLNVIRECHHMCEKQSDLFTELEFAVEYEEVSVFGVVNEENTVYKGKDSYQVRQQFTLDHPNTEIRQYKILNISTTHI
jgi:hypothetical protein